MSVEEIETLKLTKQVLSSNTLNKGGSGVDTESDQVIHDKASGKI